jgi:hypothetical protein
MIFGRVMPLYFENNMKISVSVHYLPNGTTHSTQIDILICHEKIQVKFEFGHGSMLFGRVMPLLF